jgi:hypothetical protein
MEQLASTGAERGGRTTTGGELNAEIHLLQYKRGQLASQTVDVAFD